MIADFARNWWLLALRGIAGILFGIAAFIWPDRALAALVLLFGAYVFVDGIVALAAGIGMRRQRGISWLMVLEGVAGIIVGVLTFLSPGLTALILLTFIAAWSVVTGVLEIVTAVRLRAMIKNDWLLILAGLLSILFGVLLILFPGVGALSLVWLIGSYALLFGLLTLILSVRLRSMRDTLPRQAAANV